MNTRTKFSSRSEVAASASEPTASLPVGACLQAITARAAHSVVETLSSPASRLLQGIALTVALTTLASASTVVPAKHPAAPVLLRGGTVHTVSGAVLANTDLLMADGKIAAIGPKLAAPQGADVVDVTGRHVYPGFISANSQLGLNEIQAVRATVDTNELGEVNPNARTQVAINPESELIPVARLNGVLTANITPLATPPGGGGFGGAARAAIFAGTSALVRLDGWTWEDMTLRSATAVHVYWPAMDIVRNPRNPRAADEARRVRDERLKLIRDTMASARAYAGAKSAGHADTDLRLEALQPVLRGETKLFVHANTLSQIHAALDWAQDEKFAITLVGGRDAWMVTDRLKAANVGVILAGTFNLPARRDEAYDTSYAAPGKLHAAGVKFCIAMGTDGSSETGHERNLPYEAALASGFGLPREDALKAVTLYAAELLGVEKELGSLEPGKRATLIVTNGDALEVTTNVQLAFIDGAKIDLRSRHTDLYEKYRKRLGQ